MRKDYLKLLLALVVVSTLCAPAVGADWAKQAQEVLDSPQKIAIKPMQQAPRAGDPVELNVQIQNGKSGPASRPMDTQLDVELLGKSGEVKQKTTCRVPANTADGKCSLQVPGSLERGVYQIEARPSATEPSLLKGGTFLLVRPEGPNAPVEAHPDATKEKSQRPQSQPEPERKRSELRPPSPFRVPLLNAAYFAATAVAPASPQPSPACTVSHGPAQVVVRISDGSQAGGFIAGVEPAAIQAFFEADDAGSAPSDVRIWLSQDHGNLSGNPLTIPRCQFTSAVAELSSHYAVESSVSYTVLPRAYQMQASAPLRAKFLLVYSFGVLPQEPPPQTLSLIDRAPIVLEFYDVHGRPTANDVKRSVRFVSNNSIIGTRDNNIDVEPGQSAQTVLVPYWIGTGTVNVTADGLAARASQQVLVVGLAVGIVCLLGGILGGVILYFTSRGSIFARLVVGVIAGIVLSWAYVFGLLPKVDATVAHNYISVFVVSVLGGYSGIKVFDPVLRRLGLG